MNTGVSSGVSSCGYGRKALSFDKTTSIDAFRKSGGVASPTRATRPGKVYNRIALKFKVLQSIAYQEAKRFARQPFLAGRVIGTVVWGFAVLQLIALLALAGWFGVEVYVHLGGATADAIKTFSAWVGPGIAAYGAFQLFTGGPRTANLSHYAHYPISKRLLRGVLLGRVLLSGRALAPLALIVPFWVAHILSAPHEMGALLYLAALILLVAICSMSVPILRRGLARYPVKGIAAAFGLTYGIVAGGYRWMTSASASVLEASLEGNAMPVFVLAGCCFIVGTMLWTTGKRALQADHPGRLRLTRPVPSWWPSVRPTLHYRVLPILHLEVKLLRRHRYTRLMLVLPVLYVVFTCALFLGWAGPISAHAVERPTVPAFQLTFFQTFLPLGMLGMASLSMTGLRLEGLSVRGLSPRSLFWGKYVPLQLLLVVVGLPPVVLAIGLDQWLLAYMLTAAYVYNAGIGAPASLLASLTVQRPIDLSRWSDVEAASSLTPVDVIIRLALFFALPGVLFLAVPSPWNLHVLTGAGVVSFAAAPLWARGFDVVFSRYRYTILRNYRSHAS